MFTIAKQKWATASDLDALALLYDFVVRQMYRLKYQDKPFDFLVSDANLILEIRNSIIENEITRELDDIESGLTSLITIPHSSQKSRQQRAIVLSGTNVRRVGERLGKTVRLFQQHQNLRNQLRNR